MRRAEPYSLSAPTPSGQSGGTSQETQDSTADTLKQDLIGGMARGAGHHLWETASRALLIHYMHNDSCLTLLMGLLWGSHEVGCKTSKKLHKCKG